MKREIIKTDLAPSAVGPYSQAIKIGNMLFISGQIPLDNLGNIVGGNVEDQAHQVLTNLKAIIIAANFNLENVVKCTCFLKNMDDFVIFNAVYSEYFNNILPARECVEVSKLPKDVLVEVSAICIQ